MKNLRTEKFITHLFAEKISKPVTQLQKIYSSCYMWGEMIENEYRNAVTRCITKK